MLWSRICAPLPRSLARTSRTGLVGGGVDAHHSPSAASSAQPLTVQSLLPTPSKLPGRRFVLNGKGGDEYYSGGGGYMINQPALRLAVGAHNDSRGGSRSNVVFFWRGGRKASSPALETTGLTRHCLSDAGLASRDLASGLSLWPQPRGARGPHDGSHDEEDWGPLRGHA